MKKILKDLSFAIIGAGSGGQALAGYLAAMGYRVNLYSRSIANIKDIADKKTIRLTGTINCTGKLNMVTDCLERAVSHTDIIMVVLPASAHREIALRLTPIVTPNQYIVLNPGRTGGALEFNSIFNMHHSYKKICIVEAQTLLFACRIQAPGVVKIFSKKREVKVAAFPAIETMSFIRLIEHPFPEFIPVSNVLETSFNNIGAVLHPIPTVLNCGRIEDTRGNFQYYIEGITPSIERIIRQVDEERIQVARALGVEAVSVMDWLSGTYHTQGDTLCEALRNTKGYWGIMAPSTMDTRYIFEDIPQSLVPIYDMALHLGIDTPTIASIIHLASTIHNVDYLKYGRGVKEMGLSNLLTTMDILHYVETGEFPVMEERLVNL